MKTEFGSRTKCAVARFRSVRASLDSATSRNIAIQLVLQQCCKNKLHVFCCPFIRSYLKIRTNHNRVQLREGGEHWVTPARAAAKETTNSTPGEGYSLIWPRRGCPTGQGLVFYLSVLWTSRRVYNFVRVCAKQCI